MLLSLHVPRSFQFSSCDLFQVSHLCIHKRAGYKLQFEYANLLHVSISSISWRAFPMCLRGPGAQYAQICKYGEGKWKNKHGMMILRHPESILNTHCSFILRIPDKQDAEGVTSRQAAGTGHSSFHSMRCRELL